MAVFVSKGGSVYFDGYDLKNHVSAVTIEHTEESQDCTTLGDSSRRFLSGLKVAKMDLEGYDDYDAGKIDQIFNIANGDTAVYFTIAPQGVATQGNTAYVMQGNSYEYNKFKTIGEMAKFKIHAENTGTALIPGRVLAGDQTISAGGNTTAYQWTSVGATQTLYGMLHVTSDSSLNTLTVKIQSDDNSGFTSATDRITFTATSDITAELKTLTGPVTDTYWRALWTITGGSCTATVVMGIL